LATQGRKLVSLVHVVTGALWAGAALTSDEESVGPSKREERVGRIVLGGGVVWGCLSWIGWKGSLVDGEVGWMGGGRYRIDRSGSGFCTVLTGDLRLARSLHIHLAFWIRRVHTFLQTPKSRLSALCYASKGGGRGGWFVAMLDGRRVACGRYGLSRTRSARGLEQRSGGCTTRLVGPRRLN
jgi:hypothetical protein